jgi:pantoate--beta-alanine ligase
MELITDPAAFSRRCNELREKDRVLGEQSGRQALGLVPTMGALHAGHLSLVAEAQRRARYVAVSIFVNPTQFGPGEDLERYPRDLPGDLAQCEAAGVDLVLAPTASAMYPSGDETRVNVSSMATGLCGASRPDHFKGVCTVVTKLFSLAGPCVAVFGQKDYQQLKVIERVVRDLWLPVEVVGAPIFRELDGLAMSSRNRYLDADERLRALALSAGLRAAKRRFDDGEREVAQLRDACLLELHRALGDVEYVELVHAETLRSFDASVADEAVVMAVAVRIGRTRLIDNCRLDASTGGLA